MVQKKPKTSFIVWDECVGIRRAGIDHINMCAFFGLKRKKKDHLYMGEEEKKKRKDPTQMFWVGVHELDWIGFRVFFKRPGLRISNPRWLYIYNLGYVLLVKSICTSGLYSTPPIRSEIFRINLHEVTCEISESIGRDCSCIALQKRVLFKYFYKTASVALF